MMQNITIVNNVLISNLKIITMVQAMLVITKMYLIMKKTFPLPPYLHPQLRLRLIGSMIRGEVEPVPVAVVQDLVLRMQ